MASLAVVLGLLIVAAIVGTVVTARDYRTGAQEALVRQAAANQLQVNLLNAQSANRAYILLRRGDDRSEYEAARDRYPRGIGRVRAVVRGEPDLERAAEAVDFAAQRWFDEAVAQIRLVRQGRRAQAVDRVNRGIGDELFQLFRNEHARLLAEVEEERLQGLAAADRNRQLTLVGIIGAAVLALVMVAISTRALWMRVGGPVGLLAEGVRRVARGRLSEPVAPGEQAVRELAELVVGFNAMQNYVLQERVAVAAAARREAAQQTERHLWETVQAGLLPARLPGVPGFRLAARYQPSEKALLVGGDFYDAVALPDGRLAIIVGDMAGHGAQAAAQAAGLRFGWRTLVAVNPNPAAVLAALNVQMSNPDLRAEGLFASIVYVLIDPRGGVSVAPAGHPAPLLLTAEGCRIMEPTSVGPLLGIRDEVDWPVSHGFLPPGGTLVLYTDGLVEARRGGSDFFGADRACLVLEAERRSALEARVERLIDAARRHDDEHLRDDVVVLAVERPVPLSPGSPNGRGHRNRVPAPPPAEPVRRETPPV